METHDELMRKLKAPFDEKYRITEKYTQQQVIEKGEFLPDVPPSYFPDSVLRAKTR